MPSEIRLATPQGNLLTADPDADKPAQVGDGVSVDFARRGVPLGTWLYAPAYRSRPDFR